MERTVLPQPNSYANLVHFGEENCIWPDKLCAFLLACSPILQHYKGIISDAGITILIVVFLWVVCRILIRSASVTSYSDKTGFYMVLGLLVFFLYRAVIHDISAETIIYNIIMIVIFFAASQGYLNIKYFLYAAASISIVASICIIVQYVCFYILGFHLQLAPTSLFLPESSAWILEAQTGLAGVTGVIGSLYRPSAFFMEPSHLFLYVFPHLFIVLFSKELYKRRLFIAVLLTIGLVFSTSGMGIVTAVCAWMAYFILLSGKKRKITVKSIFKPRNIMLIIAGIVLIILLFMYVPFIHDSVMRFMDRSNNGAIAGRTRLANDLLSSLHGKNLLFGVTNTTEGITFNLSGFAATLYKFGIIGIILSYSTYVLGLIRLRRQYFFISLLIIGVSFFSAHTHGTFFMLYFVFILLEGNYELILSKKGKEARIPIWRDSGMFCPRSGDRCS